jgi:hypothetical protein
MRPQYPHRHHGHDKSRSPYEWGERFEIEKEEETWAPFEEWREEVGLSAHGFWLIFILVTLFWVFFGGTKAPVLLRLA